MKRMVYDNYYLIDKDLYDEEGVYGGNRTRLFTSCNVQSTPHGSGFSKGSWFTELKIDPHGKSALEVGCGGGILTEEIALMGFDATGIDPSEQSIKIATGSCFITPVHIKN